MENFVYIVDLKVWGKEKEELSGFELRDQFFIKGVKISSKATYLLSTFMFVYFEVIFERFYVRGKVKTERSAVASVHLLFGR